MLNFLHRLATELGQLSQLDSIKVFKNKFDGSIGTQLGMLVKLTTAFFVYSNRVRVRAANGGRAMVG